MSKFQGRIAPALRARVAAVMFAALGVAGFAAQALPVAAAYPERPIRSIVPFPIGGASDVTARMLAEKFAQSWNVNVVVDNRTGATGIIGTDIVAKAPADGYTLGLVALSFAINPAIHKLPYDSAKDFSFITITASNPLVALDKTAAHTVDITGGAPEINPHFRYLVDQCVARGKHVIDRCNLTILLVPRYTDLPVWFAERGVEVVCSLPHCRKRNTDSQRGNGTFEKSIEALRRLNAAGYGHGDPRRRLTLMANPVGAFLAAPQAALEREWKADLARNHGITFDRLIALNNMPISRYLEWLVETGNLQEYMERLTSLFNPATVAGLMCRNTLSVSWDGTLHDCDFNQMLDIPVARPDGGPVHIRAFNPAILQTRRIQTQRHCFGSTAGAGSSCGGATA